MAHEHDGDYAGAAETFVAGIAFCEERGETATAQFCLACVGILSYQTGEWDRAARLWQEILEAAAPPRTRLIGASGLGLLLAQRGEAKRARTLVAEAASLSQRVEHLGTEIYRRWGLLLLEELEGDHDAVVEGWRALMDR